MLDSQSLHYLAPAHKSRGAGGQRNARTHTVLEAQRMSSLLPLLQMCSHAVNAVDTRNCRKSKRNRDSPNVDPATLAGTTPCASPVLKACTVYVRCVVLNDAYQDEKIFASPICREPGLCRAHATSSARAAPCDVVVSAIVGVTVGLQAAQQPRNELELERDQPLPRAGRCVGRVQITAAGRQRQDSCCARESWLRAQHFPRPGAPSRRIPELHGLSRCA